MDLFVVAMPSCKFQTTFTGLVAQLLVQVEPLEHTLPVQEFSAAQFTKMIAGYRFTLLAQVLP